MPGSSRNARLSRRGNAREGCDEPAPRLRQLRGEAGRPCGRRSTRRRRSASRSARSASSTSRVVRAHLDAAGVAYTLVPTLVRGLDYYSRTTWEFIGPLENENVDALGRRPLRLPRRGDRRPADPGRRVRRRIERLLLAMEAEGVARCRLRRSTSSSRSSRRRPRALSRAGSPTFARAGCLRRHRLSRAAR